MKPQLAISDLFLEVIAGLSIVALVLLPLIYYDQLPDKIPSHFDTRGSVDGKAGKTVLWWLAGIGVGIYVVLQVTRLVLQRIIRVTGEDSAMQLTVVQSGLRAFNAITGCMWLYIMVTMIRGGLGQSSGLGTYFLPVVFLSLFGVVGYIAWRVRVEG